MDKLLELLEHWPAIVTELAAIIPVIVSVYKVCNGQRCLLRSEMLRIYYANREKGVIRQYEYENFLALYGAYKALKGNSFIDKIKREVDEWAVVT